MIKVGNILNKSDINLVDPDYGTVLTISDGMTCEIIKINKKDTIPYIIVRIITGNIHRSYNMYHRDDEMTLHLNRINKLDNNYEIY